MVALFLAGALSHPPVITTILGRAPVLRAARAADHRLVTVPEHPFVALHPERKGRAAGALVDAGADDLDRVGFYLGGQHRLEPVMVEADGDAVSAVTAVPVLGQIDTADPQPYAGLTDDDAEIALGHASEVMARFGAQPAKTVAGLAPFLRARAWAHQLGRKPAPTTLRRGPDPNAVSLQPRPGGFQGFFRVDAFSVRHTRFDGRQSAPLDREALVGFDVALVLPYDPRRDTVLMVEQLRFGPLMRRDPAPWVLEPIAGFIDAGEAPIDAARREAQEETGLTLDDVRPLQAAYASPGYSSEFFHFFLALCDLDGAGGLGGLEAEDEDIRAHVVAFDHAMALLDAGEINAAPLAMMLLWLARARPRLRAVP